MGYWIAVVGAFRAARESEAGRLSIGGVLGAAVGVLLTRLAARRGRVPGVRASGATSDAPSLLGRSAQS